MNEFEEKDYGGARSYADNVKANADNIMGIFNDIDGVIDPKCLKQTKMDLKLKKWGLGDYP